MRKKDKQFNPVIGINELNNRLQKANNTLIVLEYSENPKNMIAHCSKCNQTFERERRALLHNKKCPICYGVRIVKGVNDFATFHPELMKYLTNKEDGFTHAPTSNIFTQVKCPKCGTERKVRFSNLANNGFSCPCDGRTFGRTIIGVNDIKTKTPEMLQYFKYPEKVGDLSPYSTDKQECVCPICGNESLNSPYNINKHRFSCNKCGDRLSYPNKFSRKLIEQLPVENIEYEYNRKWCGKLRYDNYFEYKGKSYFVEMDGKFHYENIRGSDSKTVKNRDMVKDSLAKEHGITMIRIDCRKSEKEYIKNSILNSDLSSIFDLSKIDWGACDLYAMKNIMIDVCNEYSKDELFVEEIAEKYKISVVTVRKYILRGKELGICKEYNNKKERFVNIRYKRRNELGKPIGALYKSDGDFISEFSNIKEAYRILCSLYTDYKFSYNTLYDFVKGKRKTSKYNDIIKIELYEGGGIMSA